MTQRKARSLKSPAPGDELVDLAAIVQNSDDAIVAKDLGGRITYWNDAATLLYGYTAQESVGESIDIVLIDDEEHRAEENDIRDRIKRGDRIEHHVTTRRRKDGRTIVVSLSISPVRDAANRIIGAAGFARDISAQRQLEAERQRAQEASQYLAAILANSDDAIVAKDLGGRITYWNAAATRMYGYTAEEAVGEKIDLILSDDKAHREEENDIRARIARGERIENHHTVRRDKKGDAIEVWLSISPVRDATGSIIGAAGFARNYSQVLNPAAIVENSDDAIVAKDLDGSILFWNDAATRMYGYTAEEAIGRSIDIIIADDDEHRSEELAMRELIAQDRRIHHHETIRRRKDGSTIEISLSISPVRNAAGQIIGAAGFARDLENQRLAAVLENSDDAIVWIDLAGMILSWNEAATRMYGYTGDEAVGHSIDITIADDDEHRREELAMRELIAQNKRIHHHETIRRRKDGSTIEISLSMSPVRNAAGQIIGAAGFARDITAAKRAEEERLRAVGLLERFMSFVSHDFKAPMHIIRMTAQSAIEIQREPAGDPAELTELLTGIVAYAEWMERRTQGLLYTSTLEGRRQSQRKVSANDAFDESCEALRKVDHFVRQAIVKRGDLPVIASDAALLGFLFQNLVQNACRYGREGVRVRVQVTASRYDKGWEFAVKDNGLGIKPHLREKIFQPSFRDPDMEVPGSGIGLDLCTRIVNWHGGRLWAVPNPRHGSTFRFTIPDDAEGSIP